jgi:hypothetical protein
MFWRWRTWALEEMVSNETPDVAGDPPTGPGGPVGPGSRIAGYLIEEQIGQGGMAVVFRARDERLDRMVALKVLAPALAADESFRQRFVRESRAAAAVDDPHIIPIYEAGEADGALYIAMRYVRGGDVGSLIRRTGPLPLDRAAAIFSPVASALDAAHAAGLVHRDVKPGNMLLDTLVGRPDHVYLSDFGLSKAWQGSTALTGSGLFLGTLDYAAPEQIEGHPMDGRTDQYALACAAFELLAGEPPFRREQPMAVMYAHVTAPPPLLSQRRAGLPPGVDQVLTRALAKSPAERYGSCGELARELRRALGVAAYGDTGDQAAPPPGPAGPVLATPGLAALGGLGVAGAAGMAGAAAGSGSNQAAVTQAPQAGPSWPAQPPVTTPSGPRAGGPPGPAGPPATGLMPGAPDSGRPAARRPRWRLPVAIAAAAALVIGGVSAAIALSGGDKPHAPLAGPSATHRASAKSVSKPSAPPASSPAVTASASPTPSATSPAPPAVPLSDFKVCTFPADTCNSSNPSQMKTEPAQIVTTGDGSGYLKSLTWSGWGTATAQGTGTLEVDNCTPNCAQGTFTGYPATVTLTNPTAYGNGNQAYADMTVSAPTSPYQPDAFDSGLVP